MRNIIFLLLHLFIIGILLLGSNFRKFSEENYVDSRTKELSINIEEKLDLKFLKKEFKPAYEF